MSHSHLFRDIVHRRFLFACLFVVLASTAQAAADEDFHTWGAVVATGALGAALPAARFWLEGQGRFDDDSSRFNQGIVRAALGHALGPRAVLWAGYAFIPTRPRGPGNDIVEHRPWQQLTWRAAAPFAGLTLSTRTRLEQRFVEGGADTGWRFRQLVKLTRPLGTDERLYLALWDEVFVNMNSTDWGARDGFDQNRVFAGLGIHLVPGWVTEVGYMNQYIDRDRRADASNHVLSLTLFLNF
jgi:hypothetical protein